MFGVSSLLYSVAFIATTAFIKEFLFLSSLNQMGFILILLHFADLTTVYVAVLFFVTYALASAGLYLFFAAIRSTVAGELSDGDLDTWPDLARFVSDSYFINELRYTLNGLGWPRNPAYEKLRREKGHFVKYSGWWEKTKFFYIGVFTSSLAVVILGGFPFLAGFFLKLAFIEAFLAHKLFYPLFAVMLTTLVTMYAYFNLLVSFKTKLDHSNSNNTTYDFKISEATSGDAVLFLILSALYGLLTLVSAHTDAFWWFVELTLPFFYQSCYYVVVHNADASLEAY